MIHWDFSCYINVLHMFYVDQYKDMEIGAFSIVIEMRFFLNYG